jgi:hypothetical protein
MITRLGSLSYDDPQWAPAFNELVSAVEHHANEEEDDFFPAASKTLGKDVAEDLKIRYVAKKNAIMSDGN